ncbi:hypothetical protein IKQ21_05085 [bacterium]|nr:hypothetical protein [bacterium]
MFNNINENNRDLLYNSQVNANNVVNLMQVRSALQKSGYASNPYVDKTEISSNAMKLFQRDLDINKFTKLATSDPEDKSYINQVQELFEKGVIDVYEDDVLADLVNNSKLWDDIKAE